jgi:solute carrier family 9 (sodium/hydrogen exchanger), member 6/7
MSRRTQLTTKFVFQITAQLSENFIFIYLGLSLFTERLLIFKPLFILITIIGICVARYCAVFPLSRAINLVIRYKAQRQGITDQPEELPYSHQVMLFWAGLRGAVGVALAAGLNGSNGQVLRATVLIVVVLTVIIFGGTTSRMLEILNIRTGVVEEIDSDDEFDIEYIGSAGDGTFSRKSGSGIGHTPRRLSNGFALGNLDGDLSDSGIYSSGNVNGSTSNKRSRSRGIARRESGRNLGSHDTAERGLLSPDESGTPSQDEDNDVIGDLDLPPAARRGHRGTSPLQPPSASNTSSPSPYPTSGSRTSEIRPGSNHGSRIANATGAFTQLISGLSEDPAQALRMIDEDFIKPHLLLDPGNGSHNHGSHTHGSGHGGSNV